MELLPARMSATRPLHSQRLTWISIMWAFFCLRPTLDICVCASTRITLQCFFRSSSSEVTPWSPLVYFFTYLVKAFFLDLYLQVP